MPLLRKFPPDSDGLVQLPPFPAEGLRGRRAYVSGRTIPLDSDIVITPPLTDVYAPIAAVEVNRELAADFTSRENAGLFCGKDGVAINQQAFGRFMEGDLMSRVTVYISLMQAFGQDGLIPNGANVLPPGNAPAPRVQFQIRGSCAQGIGAPRWQGILIAPSYDSAACLLGKTGGVLVTRWELWGRVLTAGSTNPGPLKVTVQLCVDRLGNRADDQNQYGPDVTREVVPNEAP